MPSATASTRGAEPSMPDFTATGGRSSASASSWRGTSSTGTGSHARTPSVFWAVTAVGTPPPDTPDLARTARGTALVAELQGHAVEVEEVGARVFAQLADTETPQGIIAVIELRRWTASDFAPPSGAVALVIDGVQDPGNVGTLIRK